ncbi:MAG: hypothetical protein OXG15_09810 [Gammaproteobacteria bacterium]|nr:hypothetical protein [Gammaproteobacteria bacterium]
MKWHKTEDKLPKRQTTYLGVWRTPLIPREGTSVINMGIFFFRKKDGMWFLQAPLGTKMTQPLVPEYWGKMPKYPDFSV